jgi:hypothetical protein
LLVISIPQFCKIAVNPANPEKLAKSRRRRRAARRTLSIIISNSREKGKVAKNAVRADRKGYGKGGQAVAVSEGFGVYGGRRAEAALLRVT